MLRDDLEGWNGVGAGRQAQEEGDVSILAADSNCRAESNTAL